MVFCRPVLCQPNFSIAIDMLFRFFYRCLTEVSWRLQIKAAWLWCFKGLLALRAYKKRIKKNILFPPFLFFSLTNACNLRCRGCWIAATDDSRNGLPQTEAYPSKTPQLALDSMENAIRAGQKNSAWFYTLLGGEPFLAPMLWEIIRRHPEAYFQIITNGYYLNRENIAKLKRFGNVSPLVSIDGFEVENDARRGDGTYVKAIEACRELQRQKMLYGVATVLTEQNFESALSEDYVRQFIDLGALYLWFYAFRPVGADPSPELALSKERLVEFRRRLIKLRRRMPIILIDTYWDAKGRAVCPASKGMAFVIGADGNIAPCPPLSVACENVDDNDGDFYRTMNDSEFQRRFQRFIEQHYDGRNSQGCVILDHPKELADFFRREKVRDVSGRDFLSELETSEPKTSHYLPDNEIPEDYWVYRFLKKTLFFGMGAYG